MMDDEKRERLPHFPKSLGMPLYKGLARGEVFAKDFPKTSPRPPPWNWSCRVVWVHQQSVVWV